MRCGRIAVEGEVEEIAVSPRPRSRQKHGKGSNPYSTGGLEKFDNVCVVLSAKREYIAKKIATPEALVKFRDSKNGLIPVVLRSREGIAKKNSCATVAGASVLGPVEENNGEEAEVLRRKVERNEISGGSETLTISVVDVTRHSLVTKLSQFLKTTTMGISGVYVWVRSSATAMAVGGVMSLTKFILNGISYFTAFSKSSTAMNPKDVNHENKHYHPHNSRAKTARMDNQPGTRPARPAQGFDSFYRRTSPAMAYDASVGAIIMIITLFCLFLYGKLFAIFVWMYIILIFREG